MRASTAAFFFLPVLGLSFTLEGWVPISTISTILPTQTSTLAEPQPESLPTQVPLPSQTASVIHAESDEKVDEALLSFTLDGWVAVTTFYLSETQTLPTQHLPSSSSTSEPIRSPELDDKSLEDAATKENKDSHLELRQNGGLGGGVPAAFTVPTQVSPVTTVQIGSLLVVYTQTFAPVPSQFPSALSGNIGLGTLTGSIGVVKTGEASSDGGRSKGFNRGLLYMSLLGSLLIMLGINTFGT